MHPTQKYVPMHAHSVSSTKPAAGMSRCVTHVYTAAIDNTTSLCTGPDQVPTSPAVSTPTNSGVAAAGVTGNACCLVVQGGKLSASVGSVGVTVWGDHSQVVQPSCRGGPVAMYTMPYSPHCVESMTRRLVYSTVLCTLLSTL